MNEETLSKSDEILIGEFKEGKSEAFTELIERYKFKAVRLAFVTVGNYEDAKDVSQEAFVKAHRALLTFEMKSKFSTWFYRILMNTAKDFLRKKKWKKFLTWKTSEDMENYFQSIEGRQAGPGQNLVNSELGIKMTEAIKKLPFKQGWVFTLRYLKGFSIHEISEITEISEGTVKATLHFAVLKFRKEIFPYLQEGREK